MKGKRYFKCESNKGVPQDVMFYYPLLGRLLFQNRFEDALKFSDGLLSMAP